MNGTPDEWEEYGYIGEREVQRYKQSGYSKNGTVVRRYKYKDDIVFLAEVRRIGNNNSNNSNFFEVTGSSELEKINGRYINEVEARVCEVLGVRQTHI